MYSPVICLAVFRLTLRISGQSVTVRSFEPSISKHEAGLFFSRPLHYHNTNILTRQQMNFFPVFDWTLGHENVLALDVWLHSFLAFGSGWTWARPDHCTVSEEGPQCPLDMWLCEPELFWTPKWGLIALGPCDRASRAKYEERKTNKMKQSYVYYQLLSQCVSGIIMPIFMRMDCFNDRNFSKHK